MYTKVLAVEHHEKKSVKSEELKYVNAIKSCIRKRNVSLE